MNTKRFALRLGFGGALIGLLVVALSAGSFLAAQPADRSQPIADVQVSGRILTVTPHIAYERAVLRVSGPRGYALTQRFATDVPIAVDFRADAEGIAHSQPNSAGAHPDADDRLSAGWYRYEIVFSGPASARRVRLGRFELGPPVRQDAQGFRPERVGAQPTAAGSGQISEEETLVQDVLSVLDVVGDGTTTIFMESDSVAFDWAINNSNGDIRFNEGGAGARLAVLEGGDVGVGTAAPLARMHVVGGSSQLRLEDTTGNAHFFIQNANGLFIGRPGPAIPFFMSSDATPASLVLEDSGVGIGTLTPEAKLHIAAAGNQLILEDELGGKHRFERNSSGLFVRNDLDVPQVLIADPAPAFSLSLSANGVGIGVGNPEAKLHVAGSGIIEGDVALGSSREIKHEIERLDTVAVLKSIRELPLYSWKYTSDPDQAAHVGPMAEDVYRAFAIGRDDKHLSPADAAGLALAAIQSMDRDLKGLRSANLDLAAENRELHRRLTAIEKSLADIVEQDLSRARGAAK